MFFDLQFNFLYTSKSTYSGLIYKTMVFLCTAKELILCQYLKSYGMEI